MSNKANRPTDYVPDTRLTDLFDAIDRQDEGIVESLCPDFTKLAEKNGRYADEALLGRGGLKEVYRAFDRRTQQWVALARLREDRGLQFYDMFVREAWLVSSLSHPNIIKIYDAGADEEERPFFTMDLKRGTSLADLICDSQATSLEHLLEVFTKVCDAVAYAHSQGVIHLDLKPENVQCDRFGEVLVCDWGLGRKLGDTESDLETNLDSLPRGRIEKVTMVGQIQGTLGYMAPEQVALDQHKDQRTDIFSLGCILHALLCGEPPFTGNADEVFEKTVTCSVVPLRSRFPDLKIPRSLEAVVLKATARQPADRYASAAELKQEIHQFQSGFATEAEQPGFFKEAQLFLARNRIPSAITAAALVVLTILSVLFVQRLGKQQLATMEERVRASRLLNEVNELSSEYEFVREQSVVSRKELAEQLARSAGNLKNVGIYHRPTSAVKQSQKLVDMALELDPECDKARWHRFNLRCIVFNYAAALRDTPPPDSAARRSIVELANEFPNYDFTSEHRPSPDQVISLFNHFDPNAPYVSSQLERAFIYHCSTVENGTDLSQELGAFLTLINGGAEHFSYSYDVDDGRMQIVSDREELLFTFGHWSIDDCLLRFVPARTLVIKMPGTVSLDEMIGLPVETLDVGSCSGIRLTRRISLPQLRSIRVREGTVDVGTLREKIASNHPFKIIVVN